MRFTTSVAVAASALLASSAFGGYTITQTATPGPAYSGHQISFDEPGAPTGLVPDPYTYYQGTDGLSFTSGSGFLAVEDWDALDGIAGGMADGNQLSGGFSVRFLFDSDINEISWRGWASGSPGPPFGGINVFLFKDGMQVASYSGISPFGGVGDEYFNVVADGGDTFDEMVFFNGAFNSFQSYVDEISFNDAAATLALDIKPGSCPNSFNRNSHGVLPMAVLGTADVDVTMIDLGSLQLVRSDGMGGSAMPNDGPPGPSPSYDDVSAPFDGEECECDEAGPDGFMDLVLHFRTDDVVAALELGDLAPGALVPLTLTGTFMDGTAFVATDCVRLVPPGTGQTSMAVGSNVPGAWIDVAPLDCTLDGGGYGQFSRCFPLTTQVTLTAPAVQDGREFAGWKIHGEAGIDPSLEITIDLDQATSVSAVYRKAGRVSPTGLDAVNSVR